MFTLPTVLATRVVDIWDSIPAALAIIVGLAVASGVARAAFGAGEPEQAPTEDLETPVS